MRQLFLNYRFLAALLCVLFIAGCLLALKPPAYAVSDAPWWGASAVNPTLTVLDENYRAPKYADEYCRDQEFTLRVWHEIGFWFGYYRDETFTSCAIKTQYGRITNRYPNGILLQVGGGKPYNINAFDIRAPTVQVPAAKSIFVGGNGYGLHAYSPGDFEIRPGVARSGAKEYEEEYFIKDGVAPRILEDSNNSAISGLYNIESSPNGKWLIAQKGQDLALRIMTESFEIMAFSAPVREFTQYAPPGGDLAISNDGRYAAIGGGYGPNLMVYDLSKCAPNPEYNLTAAANCRHDSLKMISFLSAQLSAEIIYVDQLRFSQSGDQLFMRVAVEYSDGRRQSKHVMLQASGTNQPRDYIALGDSYVSGEGTFSYIAGTDNEDNKCHLSVLSYPFLIGEELPFDAVHSVACSGAKMANIVGVGEGAVQYKELPTNNPLGEWLPGFQAQLNYITKYQPKIITLATIGNDIGFKNILINCMLPGTCYSTYEERYGLMLDINSKFDQLVDMYTQLKRASPASQIYVLGYPQIAKANGNCAVNVHLNSEEVAFSNGLIDYLNTTIRRATEKTGVAFVDIQNSLTGHQLCDSTATAYAMNGLTAGNDALFGTIGNESYHPTVLGHSLFAATIRAQTHNLTSAMPHANTSVSVPDETDASHLLDAPKSGNPIRRIIFEKNAEDPVLRGSTGQLIIQQADGLLQSLTEYEVWLHSDPVPLGTAETDESGNINYVYSIPEDTEPGFHTVHVYGNDSSGDPIDIQQLIYVAVTNNDWDGDGIANENETCGVIDSTGADTDHDGIDDACDSIISLSAAPTMPTQSSSTDESPILALTESTGMAPFTSATQSERLVNKILFGHKSNTIDEFTKNTAQSTKRTTDNSRSDEDSEGVSKTLILALASTLVVVVLFYFWKRSNYLDSNT